MKRKKTPGDIILHECTKNHDNMLHYSWDIVHDRWNYFLFWAVFLPFYPLTAQKIKLSKKWKKCLDISSFYTCAPKLMTRWCSFSEIWCTMAGWIDRQKKWDIEVGAPPKSISIFRTECNSLWAEKKKRNCKRSSLIRTFVYRSNIYYSKNDQRGNWKNNSSAIHFE